MRLLAGLLASAPFETALEGDESLSGRPMERVAEPLRAMGADVRTTDGHAPLVVRGATLKGIEHRTAVPSAQVKSAVLFAGLSADGETTVHEPAPTRDHTERALAHLGAPVVFEPGLATIRARQLAVALTSRALGRPWSSLAPSPVAARINHRWAIDLSPGTRTGMTPGTRAGPPSNAPGCTIARTVTRAEGARTSARGAPPRPPRRRRRPP